MNELKEYTITLVRGEMSIVRVVAADEAEAKVFAIGLERDGLVEFEKQPTVAILEIVEGRMDAQGQTP